MEGLQELVSLIAKSKSMTKSLIGIPSEKKLKTDVFYDALVNEKFATENEAADFFYSKDTSFGSYKSLKASLKEKLLNSILFLNLKTDEYNQYERDYFYCAKYMAAVRLLFSLQAKTAGINLCVKVLRKATSSNFTNYIMESAKIMREYYGIQLADWEKFNHYNEIYKQAERDWIAENRAEELYTRLILPYSKVKSSKSMDLAKAEEYHQELQEHTQHSQSTYLNFLSFYIELIIHMGKNDYSTSVEICRKALAFFTAKPFVYKTAITTFLHNILACYTQLRQFEKGMELEVQTLELLQRGSYNWFRNREQFFILAMHTKNYQKGFEIFQEAYTHQKFRFLSPAIRESWLIYRSYVHFLVKTGQLPMNSDTSALGKFRIGKFLNSVPTFSKDKRGLNIPILIMQLLFMIIRKNYDQAIDRIESIEKYSFRHLKNKSLLRSKVFIRMLVCILNSGFQKREVEKRVGKYLAKLQANPLDIANQKHEIEIIPYEDLWEIILETLTPGFQAQTHAFTARQVKTKA